MRRARVRDPHLVWDPEVGAYRAIDQTPRVVPTTFEQKRAAGHVTVVQLLAKEFGKTLRSTSGTLPLRVPRHLRDYVTKAGHADARPSTPRS